VLSRVKMQLSTGAVDKSVSIEALEAYRPYPNML